jgi:hypothetical protein
MAHDLSEADAAACWTLEWHGRIAVARMADDVLAAALNLNAFQESLDLFDSAACCFSARPHASRRSAARSSGNWPTETLRP